MSLTQAQRDMQKELIKQAEAYMRLCEEMPGDIAAAWYKLVGYLRDCYTMDEIWDGKELKFYAAGTELVKAALAADGVAVSFDDGGNGQKSAFIKSPEEVDEVVKVLGKTRLPARVLPTDIISPNGGLCNYCLFNEQNIKTQDRRAEMTLGFNKCYGDEGDYSAQECCGHDCPVIEDIAHGTPGLTAEEVTHLMFPWWWAKSRLNEARS
ncbi:MAG: hypothetical protein FWC93_07985 [Defluviitaleaceae bacterium]|nr:hypothetical protein [Defluviitaleaceae bacterium]